jgi:hypothetical protein
MGCSYTQAENALYARFLALIRRYGLMAEELLVIPWDQPGSSESKDSESQDGGKADPASAGAGTAAGLGAGLKRSASVKVAAGSANAPGKKGENEEEEEDADVEDGSEGEFRRDQFGLSTAIKKPAGSSATGKSGRGRGGTDKAVRGRRKLFQVDIPKEEDEDEIMDELEALEHVQNHGDDDDPVNAELDRFTIIANKELLEPRAEPGTEVNKSSRSRNRNGNHNFEKLRRMREANASSSPGSKLNGLGMGVEKFATPTLRDPLAGDPSRGVSVPLHDVSLNDDDDKVDHAEGGSDSDDSGGSGGSDPEEAVTGAAVDSDEEDEKMVEDVGSGL